ncbi:MAG: nitrilase-related carbon-nitrogen hydrolase, partial [Fulvivirga sp.]|nr:nitrilase-related carbon-nitrogen hydrolase [Fulvivirga sp.]
MPKPVKLAIAQYQAAHLDLEESLVKLEEIVTKAANEEIKLLVFGETWLSGYPAWLDHCPEIAQWDHEATKDAYAQLRNSCLEVPGETTKKIGQLARQHKIAIVIGVNEKVAQGPGNGTIYNSLLTFSTKGQLVNHHRKLMPTFTEKLLYGQGGGAGLKSAKVDDYSIGGLICWEHWMPLARQAMHDAGEDVHVAVWPTVFERHQIASRHYAFEGRCFVLAAGQLIKATDFPPVLRLPEYLKGNPDQWVCRGGSCIIDP